MQLPKEYEKDIYLHAKISPLQKKDMHGIVKRFIKVENGQTNLHGTVKVSGLGWQSLSAMEVLNII